MIRLSLAACLVALGVATGCGSSGGGPSSPTAPVLRVGGEYATAVTLVETSCGPVEVLSLPTSVAHVPGASTLSLTHGGTTYNGRVSADGNFVTDPLRIDGSNGQVFSVGIAGRFSVSGFEALATVDVQRPSPPPLACRYVARWVGTKSGAPNVLP